MGLFDSQAQQDAIFLADVDMTPGAEAVTYRKVTGTTRSITAHVRRFATQQDERMAVKLVIGVANDSAYGISAAELNPGGDQVLVALRPGETAQWMRVVLPVDEPGLQYVDAAYLWLELR